MNMTNPVPQLFICGAVQLLLAVPFLYTSPLNYLLGAFNLGRVFLFQWTVNFRYTDPVRALIDFVYTSRQLWQGIPGSGFGKNQNSVGAVGSGPRTRKAKINLKKMKKCHKFKCRLFSVES